MTTIAPPCPFCKHLRVNSKKDWTCPAFPKGIPPEFTLSGNQHRKPIKGQIGDTVFEPAEGFEYMK